MKRREKKRTNGVNVKGIATALRSVVEEESAHASRLELGRCIRVEEVAVELVLVTPAVTVVAQFVVDDVKLRVVFWRTGDGVSEDATPSRSPIAARRKRRKGGKEESRKEDGGGRRTKWRKKR
jgi:hypothetical protein